MSKSLFQNIFLICWFVTYTLSALSQDQDVGDLVQINNCIWRGAEKPITSIWIGKSVELEMALYTVCFRTRLNQNCNIEVNGGKEMTIVNYDIDGTDYIGTAYPSCWDELWIVRWNKLLETMKCACYSFDAIVVFILSLPSRFDMISCLKLFI